jgi:hypothetical protein
MILIMILSLLIFTYLVLSNILLAIIYKLIMCWVPLRYTQPTGIAAGMAGMRARTPFLRGSGRSAHGNNPCGWS